MCCKITRDKTLNTVSLPEKEQSLQKKKFVPSVEMLPEVTQRDLNVEAWVAFQALLEDRLERSWNVESKGCLIWERTCQTGIPCFCRSCCGGFLREDSLVEVREMPVTKYQSESPNEAGNT